MKIAVGFFDGVHLGHQAILEGADAAITFSNHPLSVLAPERAPALIMREEDRYEAIKSCGVRDLTVLEFTRDLASLDPAEFAFRHLRRASASSIRCGENWRFGKGGKGNAEFLRTLGFGAEVVPYAVFGGERVSSSRIRAALAEGRIEEANAMTGRPFSLVCAVRKGKGLGTKMGFPTVNFVPLSPSAPGARLVELPHGVYSVEVAGARGVANWGLAPTMGAKAWESAVLEVHFPGGAESVPEKSRVSILRFIRPERRFESLESLKSQIACDIEDTLLTAAAQIW